VSLPLFQDERLLSFMVGLLVERLPACDGRRQLLQVLTSGPGTEMKTSATNGAFAGRATAQTTGASDPQGQARNAASLQGLQQLGWSEGRNLRIETRWNAADAAVNMLRNSLGSRRMSSWRLVRMPLDRCCKSHLPAPW